MAGSCPRPHFTESQPHTQPSPGTQRSFIHSSDSYSLDVYTACRAKVLVGCSEQHINTLWSLHTCGDNQNFMKSQQV